MVLILLNGLTQMDKELHKLTCTVQFAQVTVVCKGGGYGHTIKSLLVEFNSIYYRLCTAVNFAQVGLPVCNRPLTVRLPISLSLFFPRMSIRGEFVKTS